jgi:1,2-diacylglycerol 3-alpha-glucosyltransferase
MIGSGARVAIACSGLGHVQRGIEAWATDTARGLQRAGIQVDLFGGGPGPGITALANLPRTSAANAGLARVLRQLGGWRYGCGSPYEVEQTTFCASLWRHIHRTHDILHVQDPTIAWWFERLHRLGLSRPRVIYANGTGEPGDLMRRFRYLQVLTQQARAEWSGHEPPGQAVFTIPNFIDTAAFTPGDRAAARDRLGLPRDSRIVLCSAAIRKFHKRIDVLLKEFSDFSRTADGAWLLVIAGGRETDTDELIREGTALLGNRVRFLPALPRTSMPDLYRAADVFTLASLYEMFGIVLLEAMASGLPVLCHDAPSFRDIVGPAGHFGDFSQTGGMSAGLRALSDPVYRSHLSAMARQQVEARFSESVVIRDILAMYDAVMRGT